MALIKSIDTQYGIPAEYWKITRVDEYFAEHRISVIFSAYVNKEAREAGKSPLAQGANLEIAGDQYIPDATRQQIYEIAKLLPEFEGAQDS